MKQYHNNVKRQLINKFAGDVDSLLDLACGRGGDLWKWIDANVLYVKGLDLSPYEIQEAQKRYSEAIQKRPDIQLTAEFAATEDLGKREVNLGRQFDVVTCMFAIHYFFASKAAADNFFRNVSINLKQGGYFFGTVPDGRMVQETIHKWGKWPRYDKPMLKLQACWEGDVKLNPFGCGYTCAIGDTVTEGHGDSSGSFEYLVFRGVLEGVAKDHGFTPIVDLQDPKLDRLFQEADKGKCCKHFAPKFPETGDAQVDSSLTKASELNMAFVFRKTGDSKAAASPTPEAGVKREREESGIAEHSPAKKRQGSSVQAEGTEGNVEPD